MPMSLPDNPLKPSKSLLSIGLLAREPDDVRDSTAACTDEKVTHRGGNAHRVRLSFSKGTTRNFRPIF